MRPLYQPLEQFLIRAAFKIPGFQHLLEQQTSGRYSLFRLKKVLKGIINPCQGDVMKINIISPEQNFPLDRAYVVNIMIRSFKGRKDVEVHLYRPWWNQAEEEEYDWGLIVNQSHGRTREDMNKSRKVVMELFTASERDALVGYLRDRYSEKLRLINSAPLSFPVPVGLSPLSMLPENENHGRIRFERIPNYSLPFPVHGFYDLSAHAPILTGEEI